MNAPARLGVYAACLGLVLGGGSALGATVGPEPDDRPADAHGDGHPDPDSNRGPDRH